MSTNLSTIEQGATLRAIDAPDVTVSLVIQAVNSVNGVVTDINGRYNYNSGTKIGIIKGFQFTANFPKTPVHVLSQLEPAGYSTDPQDKGFTLTQLEVFDRVSVMPMLMNADTNGLQIMVEIFNKSFKPGQTDTDTVRLLFSGIFFDSVGMSFQAGGSNFDMPFGGKFTHLDLFRGNTLIDRI